MSDDSSDRRRDERLDVGWPGTIATEDDRRWPCRIVDISTAGTKIESEAEVTAGEEVLLSLPDLGEFAGKVQWTGAGAFGLALQAGPDLLLKRVAEDPESYPGLAAGARSGNDNH